MMMFAQMGLGLLANLVVQGASRGAAANPQAQALMRSNQAAVNRAAREALHQVDDVPHALNVKTPPFPEEAARDLRGLQQEHAEERQAVLEDTKQQIVTRKDALFEQQHLETRPAENGREQVVLDEQGRPRLVDGPETPPQRQAREGFEEDVKTRLDEKHSVQREELVHTEKQEVSAFLQEHKPELNNPAVQGELQKLILQAHKKALQLNRDQEAERLRADLYDEEQQAVADAGLKALHELEDRHGREEDESPAAQLLLAHHEDTAEVLREARREVREQEQAEMFLKGRPNFNRPATQAETDVARALPAHLSNALYQMGIYTV